jgi:hypothetical protein
LPPFTGPDVLAPYLQWSWAYSWASMGAGRNVSSLPTERANAQDAHPIFMARASFLTVEQQKSLVSNFHVEIYEGDVWVVDRRAPPLPPDAYSFDEREPSLWEWYFIGGVEPIRRYVRDPFATWEWRIHLGLDAPAPESAPKTLEQARIAHNMAIASGDATSAARLRARLEGELVHDPACGYSEGLSLLGYHPIRGTEPRIVLFFQASGATKSDATFTVHAQVEAKKAFSLIPVDPLVRDVAMPAALSTKLYRPGFIYSFTVVLRQRVGVERFWGGFQSKDGSTPPVRVDGRPETVLLVAK